MFIYSVAVILQYDTFVVYRSIFILSTSACVSSYELLSVCGRFTVDQLLGMELCTMCRAYRVNLV